MHVLPLAYPKWTPQITSNECGSVRGLIFILGHYHTLFRVLRELKRFDYVDEIVFEWTFFEIEMVGIRMKNLDFVNPNFPNWIQKDNSHMLNIQYFSLF